MAKRRYYANSNEYYAGSEERNRQESEDGAMISKDMNAVANMPQNVKQVMYPQPDDYLPETIDDTIRGIDEQMRADNEGRRKNFKPKKF